MTILKRFLKTIKGIFRRRKKNTILSRRRKKRSAKRRVSLMRRKIKPAVRRAKVKRTKLFKKKPLKAPAAKVAMKPVKSPSEIFVGDITHYFSKIMVCVVKLKGGPLNVRERIRIRGSSTDFIQTVDSMQIESVDVKSARRGQLIGLKISKVARPGDKVFKIGA